MEYKTYISTFARDMSANPRFEIKNFQICLCSLIAAVTDK